MARPSGTKNIQTPEKLWELFIEYKEWVKSNPILKMVFVGKDGIKDYEERERPLTIDGFECYLYDKGVIGDLSHYFANTDNKYSDYLTICTRIRKSVRNDQIEGGMANIYNPSITQRLNGLTEKTETKLDNNHSGSIKIEVIKSDVSLHNSERDINLDV
jgi:hypothetical protein